MVRSRLTLSSQAAYHSITIRPILQATSIWVVIGKYLIPFYLPGTEPSGVPMAEIVDTLKNWIYRLTELGIGLIALGIVIQILFDGPVAFLPGGIIGNLTGLIASLGSNGLVGLIALAIILYLFTKRGT